MPDPVTGTIVGATTLIGAGIASSAASKASKAQVKGAETAADAQVRAAEIAAETTKEMYYQGWEDVAPWRTAGVMALEKLLGPIPGISPEIEAPKREDYTTLGTIPEKATSQKMLDQLIASEKMRGGVAAQELIKVTDQLFKEGKISGIQAADLRERLKKMGQWGGLWWDVTGAIKQFFPANVFTDGSVQKRVLDEDAYQRALANYEREVAEREARVGKGLLGEGAEIGLETSPGYQFRLSEGAKTLENAAVGKKLSPSTAKALTRYGQEYASSEYDKLINRYYALAGLGQTSAGQMASGALTTGSNLANLQVGAGQAQGLAALQAANARATGYVNQANIWGGALGGGADLYALWKMGAFNKTGTAV